MTQRLGSRRARAVGGVRLYVANTGLPKTLLDLVFSETQASDEAFAAASAEFQPKDVSNLTIAIA